MAKILCSYLYLFDTIIDLHAMNEKHSMTFSFESESGFLCVIKFSLMYDV